MILRCIFHVHTCHSLDSMLSPESIVNRARELGADVLAVTDHNSIRGSEDAARIAEGNPRHVIRGGEYKTEKGDVIGLFLREEITARKSDEVIREIHKQGGLAVLPHPYKGHRLDEEFIGQVDLIETFNARCTAGQNQAARELAEKWGKPQLAGSDAHCFAEIGAAVNEIDVQVAAGEAELAERLLLAPRTVKVNFVSKRYQPYSQMIKAWKTKDPVLFGYQFKRLVGVVSKELFSGEV